MAQKVECSKIDETTRSKVSQVAQHFADNFSGSPQVYAVVPGRVNLIGEHIDYCGYGVLPMAIEQTVIVAARKTDSALKFSSTSHDFEDYTGDISNYVINSSNPRWFNYVLCGFRGVIDSFDGGRKPSVGMECGVHGNVPRCAGLSSSSALVCASALAYLKLCGLEATRLELADACQQCERYIGTCGGGMDQAVAFLAEAGQAKFIEFEPVLNATNVSLPVGYSFIVANSCAELNKAATSHFNQRVLETRLAARLLAKALKVPDSVWASKPRPRLAEIQLGVKADRPGALVISAESLLHSGPYTIDEVTEELGITKEQLIDNDFPANTRDVTEFWLKKRAKHVFSEAERVLAFRDACLNTVNKPAGEVAAELGALMNDSHDSCRFDYQCSHPQLDQLVSICRKAGALGSRLTGAGWGGCCVSLVRNEDVSSFMTAVCEQYYTIEESTQGKDPVKEGWLFASRPGRGAACYE